MQHEIGPLNIGRIATFLPSDSLERSYHFSIKPLFRFRKPIHWSDAGGGEQVVRRGRACNPGKAVGNGNSGAAQGGHMRSIGLHSFGGYGPKFSCKIELSPSCLRDLAFALPGPREQPNQGTVWIAEPSSR